MAMILKWASSTSPPALSRFPSPPDGPLWPKHYFIFHPHLLSRYPGCFDFCEACFLSPQNNCFRTTPCSSQLCLQAMLSYYGLVRFAYLSLISSSTFFHPLFSSFPHDDYYYLGIDYGVSQTRRSEFFCSAFHESLFVASFPASVSFPFGIIPLLSWMPLAHSSLPKTSGSCHLTGVAVLSLSGVSSRCLTIDRLMISNEAFKRHVFYVLFEHDYQKATTGLF
jgi:hypothetical protein